MPPDLLDYIPRLINLSSTEGELGVPCTCVEVGVDVRRGRRWESGTNLIITAKYLYNKTKKQFITLGSERRGFKFQI